MGYRNSTKDRFPRLFNISLDQSSLVKDLGLWDDANWVWNLKWFCQLRSWELEQSNALLDMLYNLNHAPNRNDRLIWVHDNEGLYSVKSVTNVVFEAYRPTSPPLVNGV